MGTGRAEELQAHGASRVLDARIGPLGLPTAGLVLNAQPLERADRAVIRAGAAVVSRVAACALMVVVVALVIVMGMTAGV